MEIDLKKKEVKMSKEINRLDQFVIDFCEMLKDYVIVSGYVSILFGRSRATEDVDLIIPPMTFEEFDKLWKKTEKNGFECVNTLNSKEAFESLNHYAIRFCRKNEPVPNMEFKQASNEIHRYSLKNRINVFIGNHKLFISPIEMQIVYKLMLGKGHNRKDLEDAKHIYEIFKDKLNKNELNKLIKEFKVEEQFEIIK
jgi:hypothetical protein